MPRLYDWLNDQQRNPKIIGSRLNDEFNRIAWDNTRVAKTANYTVTTGDQGSTIELSGNTFFTLTFAAASGYASNHANLVVNADSILSSGRGKLIAGSGGTDFVLYPGQSCWVFNLNNVWYDTRPNRWRPPPSSAIVFYSDYTNGTDSKTTTDGLATGSSAYKTGEFAFYRGLAVIDADGHNSGQTTFKVRLADNTTDAQGFHLSPHSSLVGAQGGLAVTIEGGTASVVNPAVTGFEFHFAGKVRLKDLYIGSTAGYGIAALDGSHVYLDNIHLLSSFSGQAFADDSSRIKQLTQCFVGGLGAVTAPYGILTQNGGRYSDLGTGITFIDDATYTTFLLGQTNSTLAVSGTINAGGKTLSGKGAESDTSASVSYSALPVAFAAPTQSGNGTLNGV